MAAWMVMGVERVKPAAEYTPGPTHKVEPGGVEPLATATEVYGC
jgi:hypothetical protein